MIRAVQSGPRFSLQCLALAALSPGSSKMCTRIFITFKCRDTAERVRKKTYTGPLFYLFPCAACPRARNKWQIKQDDLYSGRLSRCQGKNSPLSSREPDRLMSTRIASGDMGHEVVKLISKMLSPRRVCLASTNRA